LRNLAPAWFFGPGIGKLALRRGNGFKYLQYAPAGYSTVEEVNFGTNGLVWTPEQAVSRQAPVGTGALAVENVPHVGLFPGDYGGGFLWLDLGAYEGTTLALPMTAGQSTLTVEDGDALALGMVVVVGSERLLLGARDENTFAVSRGQEGTTAAAHSAGDGVTPRLGGANQTGPRWDSLEVRRREGRPAIRSGAILTSNLASPGDPSVGAAKWERHPDWTLLTRFDNSAGSPVLSFRPPEGARQARHVCVGDVLMHRWQGVAQRLKVNEVVVREYVPGASAAAGWAGHGATDQAQAAAHALTQHGGLPAAKVSVEASPAPMGDLPVAASPLARILANLEDEGGLAVWLDPQNVARVAPAPGNPQWDQREPYVTLDAATVLGDLAGAWGVRSPVSQVRGTFTETAALRTHRIAYPDVPGVLGRVVDIRGTVRSWAEGRDRCQREYRLLNARRTPQGVTIGPAPWLRPWLRVVYDSAELDAGGQWAGVNAIVESYRCRYEAGPAGGAVCTCALTLREVVL
jgi:hypothetical protein